jgi:hypothetical protein
MYAGVFGPIWSVIGVLQAELRCTMYKPTSHTYFLSIA